MAPSTPRSTPTHQMRTRSSATKPPRSTRAKKPTPAKKPPTPAKKSSNKKPSTPSKQPTPSKQQTLKNASRNRDHYKQPTLDAMAARFDANYQCLLNNDLLTGDPYEPDKGRQLKWDGMTRDMTQPFGWNKNDATYVPGGQDGIVYLCSQAVQFLEADTTNMLKTNPGALWEMVMIGKSMDSKTARNGRSIAQQAIQQFNQQQPAPVLPPVAESPVLPSTPILERLLDQGQQTLSALRVQQGQIIGVIGQQEVATAEREEIRSAQRDMDQRLGMVEDEQNFQRAFNQDVASSMQETRGEMNETRFEMRHGFNRMNRGFRNVQHAQMRLDRVVQPLVHGQAPHEQEADQFYEVDDEDDVDN